MEYYNILNLKPNATREEIKKAYRQKALEHHPDKGGNPDMFRKINNAYNILTNSDFKINLQKCDNSKHIIEIPLNTVYFGDTKRFKIHRQVLCNFCNTTCENCNGTGIIKQSHQISFFQQIFNVVCPRCNKKGIVKGNMNCSSCKDKQYVTETKIIEINIEKGVYDNQVLDIITDWGIQPSNFTQIAGDLYIVCKVLDHPDFRRRGDDLFFTPEITLSQSLVGGNILIPHLSGSYNFDITGFGIIDPNQIYTVIGKGLPSKSSNKYGNLDIQFKIVYPKKTFNQIELQKFKHTLKELNLLSLR